MPITSENQEDSPPFVLFLFFQTDALGEKTCDSPKFLQEYLNSLIGGVKIKLSALPNQPLQENFK